MGSNEDQDINDNQEANVTQKANVTLFVKVGIVILSIIMIVGFGIQVFPDTITVSSTGSKRDLPIYCVNLEEKQVALSFDTAWGNDDTQNILDILAKHNIKATFFMTGEWVDKYPYEVKAIAKAGHDLGNHSESHVPMSQLTKAQSTEEIMLIHNQVKALTGIDMTLFRVPYSVYSDELLETAREWGYYTIQWDVERLNIKVNYIEMAYLKG